MTDFNIKIRTIDNSRILLSDLKKMGNRIIFTNGCFDILHLGHVTYLQQARSLGDILIVGLNSDASVARLKGSNRPIKNQQNRAGILAALESVSMVIVFDEDTPIDLIEAISPDVLAKGGDYTIDTIAGAEFVINNGGMVQVIDLVDGLSSSRLIDKGGLAK